MDILSAQSDITALKKELHRQARAVGFDDIRICDPAQFSPRHGEGLQNYVAAKHHGTMDWMVETQHRRAAPAALWPQARSVIMLAMNYGPDCDPLSHLDMPDHGGISVYARGKDYHVVVKKKLKNLAGWLHRASEAEVKVFVDTAPVMEKPLGQQAGLGWAGKHTNLVSKRFGSWLFLGSIFTTLKFEVDEEEHDHCGSCRRCLDVCPTKAFPAPYQLDARRCISYLTIEHKDHIPLDLRQAMGNRIFGCDDCLAVCPWNKYAQAAQESRLAARAGLVNPPLTELIALDKEGFQTRFQGTPVKRAGYEAFIRNVLIAIGNGWRVEKSNAGAIQQSALYEMSFQRLGDPAVLVRAMAVWACGQIWSSAECAQHYQRYGLGEQEQAVQHEWQMLLRQNN